MALNSSGASKVVQFKLVLLGDSAVGKSSLVLRFVRGQFFEYQESTIGAAFLTQNVSLNDYTVKFEIWDTAGQERYHSLAPVPPPDRLGLMASTDVLPGGGGGRGGLRHHQRGAGPGRVGRRTGRGQDSFQRAKSWVKELQRQGSPNIVIALAGNKFDLATKRKVDTEEAKEYAKDNGLFFMETSAKTATNVTELFKAIAKKLPKDPYKESHEPSQPVDLSGNQADTESSGGCCKS